MEAIIVAIISGFFSLFAVWYQNYLGKKPKDREKVAVIITEEKKPNPVQQPLTAKQRQIELIRVIFMILILVLPWISLLFLDRVVAHYSHFEGDYETKRYIFALYFLTWFIITSLALIIGFKTKAIFEKAVMIVASLILLCLFIALKADLLR